MQDPGSRMPMQDPGSRMPMQDSGSRMPMQDPGSWMPMQDPGSLMPVNDPGSLLTLQGLGPWDPFEGSVRGPFGPHLGTFYFWALCWCPLLVPFWVPIVGVLC